MKRYILVCLVMLGIFIITAGVGVHAAQVQGTRHDLSAPSSGGTGPGPIRSGPSGGTSEICVFCHTPHGSAGASFQAPLWNKNFNIPAYQVYTSDVLSQLTYPGAEQPLPSVRAVHLKSRLCLTCHDGTIALGTLANWPSGYSSDIPMSSSGSAITTMPATAEGYIGVDLRDDHPVAIQYTNAQDPELALSPAAKVKVFSDGVNNYVECTSCHDPHDNTNPPFLVDTNAGSAICTKCHSSKAGYTGSIHETHNTITYQPPDGPGGLPDLGSTIGGVNGVKCMVCHYPHKAAVSNTTNLPSAPYADLTTYPKLGQYLLALQEEMTCYNEKNRWGQGATNVCHAGAGGKNIKAEALKGNHRVANYTGKHEATEHRVIATGLAKYNWVNTGGTGGWHVECDDCHNSHTAKNTNHTRGTNAVGATSPLYGAGGVSVSGWPSWGVGTGTYAYIEPQGVLTTAASTVTMEYQICFKCHADFAWSNNPPAASTAGFGNLTNQALEFGTNSPAYHPVANTTTAAGHQPATPQGTYSAPWNANPGNQTMYCSDCHTKEGDGAPTGPHGSTNSFILRAAYSDTYNAQGTDQLVTDVCFQCHPSATYFAGAGAVTGFSGGGINLHTQHQTHAGVPAQTTQGYKCVNCHTRVPHGWWRKGMIVVRNDGLTYGPQYEAGGAGAGLITGYTPPALGSGNYAVGLINKNNDCTTMPGCH